VGLVCPPQKPTGIEKLFRQGNRGAEAGHETVGRDGRGER
jgi:hypothetical protein